MKWDIDDALILARNIQQVSKPIVIAANKADVASEQNKKSLERASAILTSSDFELALKNASKANLIEYSPGSSKFSSGSSNLKDNQINALKLISDFLEENGSTGVQECLEKAVLDKLDLIAIYPVEDETHFTDGQQRVLPDAFLLPRGSTALDLAYKVHTDIGDSFIRAIDCNSKRVIGRDHELSDGDIIKIVAGS